MTDTLIRMTYLGDGISTDEEGVGREDEEGEPYAPSPAEETPDDNDLSETSEE